MIRYFIALILFFLGTCFGILSSGGSLLSLLDLPTFIIVGIFPFLFASILHGFKNMASAFSVSVKKEADSGKAAKALDFFKTYGKLTWIAGIIGVITGFICILAYLEDASALGPNTAVTLLSILYSGIIYAVVIIPFTMLAKRLAKRD